MCLHMPQFLHGDDGFDWLFFIPAVITAHGVCVVWGKETRGAGCSVCQTVLRLY